MKKNSLFKELNRQNTISGKNKQLVVNDLLNIWEFSLKPK